MRRCLNLTQISFILGVLLWGCALSGKNVPLSEKSTAEQTYASPYISLRSQAYNHFLRSRQHLYQNRMNEAVAELEMAVAADPDSPYLFLELASFYLRQSRNAEALAAAEKAKSLDPNSVKARMLLAGLYSTLKQPARAIAEYRAVLELEPKQHKALL